MLQCDKTHSADLWLCLVLNNQMISSQQDFFIADASENQVFLAVAHSASTTHLYISDTTGIKYSLSLERVLYFSHNTSSAWLR